MNGSELRQLLQQKWGYSFDVQIRRVQGKIFVLIMWRYLEQASFPLSEAEYLQHLEAIATYLQGWGASQFVQDFIAQTKEKPRLGKAISILIPLSSAQLSEWIVDP